MLPVIKRPNHEAGVFPGVSRQVREIKELISARRFEREVFDLKYELAALRFRLAAVHFAHVCRKAGYSPDQPRVPAGSRGGGQWIDDSGGSASSAEGSTNTVATNLRRVRFADATGVLGPRTLNDASGGGPEMDASQITLAGAKQSAAYCWNQMQIDMLLCSSLRPTSVVAACRAQANERYSACLTGKPIPPLPF